MLHSWVLTVCFGVIRQEEERRRREEEMMIRQREMEEQMRRQREENYSRMGYMDPVSEIMMFFGYIIMFRNFLDLFLRLIHFA